MRALFAFLVCVAVAALSVLAVTSSRSARRAALPVVRSGLTAVQGALKAVEAAEPAQPAPSVHDLLQARVAATLDRRQHLDASAADADAALVKAQGDLDALFNAEPPASIDDPRALSLAAVAAGLRSKCGDARARVDDAARAYDFAVRELHAFETGGPSTPSALEVALDTDRAKRQGAAVAAESSRLARVQKELAAQTAETSAALVAKRQADQAAADAQARLLAGQQEADRAAAGAQLKLLDEQSRRVSAEAEAQELRAAHAAAPPSKPRHWVAASTTMVLKKEWTPRSTKTVTEEVDVPAEFKDVRHRVWVPDESVVQNVFVKERWDDLVVRVHDAWGWYDAHQFRHVQPHTERVSKWVPAHWTDVVTRDCIHPASRRAETHQIDTPAAYRDVWVEQFTPRHQEDD